MSEHDSLKFNTLCIHAGQEPDPTTGAVVQPISLSTTFQQEEPGVNRGYDYSRSGNPTRKAFEECVAALEHGSWGLAFASGSATLNAVANLLKAGDEILAMDDLYGGSYRYLANIGKNNGVTFKQCDLRELDKIESFVTPQTKLIWVETPTNPTLKIVDIEAVSKIAKKHNLIFVVDNTFLSPYFQSPLDLGADLVVHSVSKYINGHSDVIMGVCCGRDQELHKRLKFIQNSIGAIPSAFDSWLVIRGLKTLHVRMKRHEENAKAVANFLLTHDAVDKVIYPGLESHPDHAVAKKQMKGFGGMVTFNLKGTMEESKKFLTSLKVWALAESLGAVESLVDHPAIMTHAAVPKEEREKLGILDTLVRLSVGIEDIDDLLADLKQALDNAL
mmetsp:Transcript_24618/g.27398  ORF Transcript_24618/g.27398 Transcript_24618/m.27398 type:complete len:388 (-) Transcript_24618:48-1211(-)